MRQSCGAAADVVNSVIGKLKFGLVVGFLVLAGMSGWQVGRSEIANVELQDDIRDLASRLGTRVGYSAPKSDDDYRNEVIREADQYGIALAPDQVSVVRTGTDESPVLTITVDYTVPIKVPGFVFNLHFTPTSERS